MTKQEEQQAYELADALKARIFERTGIKPEELQCPREKSDMTPCIARDGGTAVAFTTFDVPICVGCEYSLTSLIAKEDARTVPEGGAIQ